MIICPSCGADMHFAPSTQMLVCDYCETSLEPEKYAYSEGLLSQDSEYYETTIFSCPQCGGEIMNTEETAATFCSYCGASVQLMSRIGKEKRPEKIIPFIIDTKECQESFKKRVKKAIFAPKFLRNDSEIEKFRGIYMPYWSYGFAVDQNMSEDAESKGREGDYIVTSHYKLKAKVTGDYNGISFDSASNFDDDISESISPFETQNAKDFNPAYMSGFYADKGDVSSDVYLKKAEDYLKSDVTSEFKALKEFGGLTIVNPNVEASIETHNPRKTSVLYPVWFLTNHFGKDRVTYAVVNGQTGKIAADIPIDPIRYIIISLIVTIPVFMILNILPAIEPSGMIFYTMILHIICTIIAMYQDYTIQVQENHEDDAGYNSIKSEKEDSETDNGEVKSKIRWRNYIYQIAILITGIILFLFPFTSDYVYYAFCTAIMVGVALAYIRIIKQHNILTTHKLPQLEKRGGDENA